MGAIKRRQVRSDSSSNQADDQDSQWTNGIRQETTNIPSDVVARDLQRPARLRIESMTESESEENSLSTLTVPTVSPTAGSVTETTNVPIASSDRTSTLQQTTTASPTTVGSTITSTKPEPKTETARQTNTVPTVVIASTNPATTTVPITTATVTTTTPTPTTATYSASPSSSNLPSSLRPVGKANSRQRPFTVTSEPPLRSKQLEATFEAFKFPTTNIVQFRAVVTPCLGECVPAHCQLPTPDGSQRAAQSFGRRRRRSVASKRVGRKASEESLVVVQSIQINDKFDSKQDSPKLTGRTSNPMDADNLTAEGWTSCLTAGGLGLVVGILLFGQLAVIAVWLHVRGQWHQWRHRSWTPRHSKDMITPISDHCRH